MTAERLARWLEVFLDWNGKLPPDLKALWPVEVQYTESEDHYCFVRLATGEGFTLKITESGC